MLREWYMHPNGQIPAYEWAFGDVNPPVHAWAALRVFEIDGSRDHAFLARVFQKLLLNFTWWIALVLARHDRSYEDAATKFFEHFAYIAEAMSAKGLWSEDDGYFYDVLAFPDGERAPLRVRSIVGLLPLAATTTLGTATLEALPDFAARFRWFLEHKPAYRGVVGAVHERDGAIGRQLAVVDEHRLVRILATMLDEREFLSPFGLRALSAHHREHPFTIELDGASYPVDYEPGESTSGLFGGNSNWRGPIWFPVNYLVIEALRRYARFHGGDLLVEHPTGSGRRLTLDEIADDLSARLVRIFTRGPDDARPVLGDEKLFQTDPRWRDLIPFHEYFHGALRPDWEVPR